MRGIIKRFPGVQANDHASLTIQAGEIHALLGENGAGKSTLMQILYGFQRMDAGEILIDGKPVLIGSPKDAIASGIGMVHQEFMLIGPLSVVENTVLGLKEKSGPMLDLQRASKRLRALSNEHQLSIDPAALIRDLPMGVQQRVEILKLLYREARLLILDEPTAVLTPPEKNKLFSVLRSLRAQGRSIVIVTHKLHEIIELADRVTVMRDGRTIATLKTEETTGEELARLMVGRNVNLHAARTERACGVPVLQIMDLHAGTSKDHEKLHGLSLEISAGEIVGIAGVDGNGQAELAQALLHLFPIVSGTVLLNGFNIKESSTNELRKRGVAYIPADRRGVGSIAEFSVADNAMLGSQRERMRGPFIDRKQVKKYAQTLMQRFDIRSSGVATTASKLSGGNLQKLILGREIMRGAKAMVVEQPSRGLDVGAVESVWKELLQQREQGVAILLISAELEELMNLCDRIAVMFEGRIVGIVDAERASLEELGWMMAGSNPNLPSALDEAARDE